MVAAFAASMLAFHITAAASITPAANIFPSAQTATFRRTNSNRHFMIATPLRSRSQRHRPSSTAGGPLYWNTIIRHTRPTAGLLTWKVNW